MHITGFRVYSVLSNARAVSAEGAMPCALEKGAVLLRLAAAAATPSEALPKTLTQAFSAATA